MIDVLVYLRSESDFRLDKKTASIKRVMSLSSFMIEVTNKKYDEIVIEYINKNEYAQAYETLQGIIDSNHEIGVSFYIRDNDEITCGLADVLSSEIYLNISDYQQYLTLKYNQCFYTNPSLVFGYTKDRSDGAGYTDLFEAPIFTEEEKDESVITVLNPIRNKIELEVDSKDISGIIDYISSTNGHSEETKSLLENNASFDDVQEELSVHDDALEIKETDENSASAVMIDRTVAETLRFERTTQELSRKIGKLEALLDNKKLELVQLKESSLGKEEELRKIIERAGRELSEANKKIELISSVRDELQEKLFTADEKIRKEQEVSREHKDKSSALELGIHEKLKEIGRLNDETEELNRRIDQLRAEASEYRILIDKSRVEIEEHKVYVGKIDTENEELKNKVLSLEDSIKKYEAKIVELEAMVSDAVDNINKLKVSITELEQERDTLKDEISRLKEQAMEANNEASHNIAILTEEKGVLEKEVIKLRAEAAKSMQDVAEVIKELRDQVSIFEESISKKDEDIAKYVKQIEQLGASKVETEEKEEEYKNTLSALEKIMSSVGVEYTGNKIEDNVGALCEKHAELILAYDRLKAEYKEVSEQIQVRVENYQDGEKERGTNEELDAIVNEHNKLMDEIKKVYEVIGIQGKGKEAVEEIANEYRKLKEEAEKKSKEVLSLNELIKNGLVAKSEGDKELSLLIRSVESLKKENQALKENGGNDSGRVQEIKDKMVALEFKAKQDEILLSELRAKIAGIEVSSRKNYIDSIEYTGNGKIVVVGGITSSGITSVAVGIADSLATRGKTLIIDMDLASPRANEKYKKSPFIKMVSSEVPYPMNTGIGYLMEKGAGAFIERYSALVIKAVSNQKKYIDLLSGMYGSVETDSLNSVDYTRILNFLGGIYDYIVIDVGKFGSSMAMDRLSIALMNAASCNIHVSNNDRLEVRMLAIKLGQYAIIDDSRRMWILNKCVTTAVDKLITDSVGDVDLELITYAPELEIDSTNLGLAKSTKDRFKKITTKVEMIIHGQ